MDVKRLEDYLYYYEENPSLKIYCGDSQEILPLLPKSDVVLTDPPYDKHRYNYGLVFENTKSGRRAAVALANKLLKVAKEYNK